MTHKEMILDSLIDDDEAFTQIAEYFELVAEVEISPSEIKKLLEEMLEEGYIVVNYSWQNEHYEYPYTLTEKGKKAWNEIEEFIDDKYCLDYLKELLKGIWIKTSI